MSTNRTRADYDQLAQIAQRFRGEQEKSQQMLTQLRQLVSTLRGGDWVGQGASAFFAEMDSSVLPSLQRLNRAMESASRVTMQINNTIKEAENEASHILDQSSNQTGSGAQPSGASASPNGSASGVGTGDSTNTGTSSGSSPTSGSTSGPVNGAPVRDVNGLYTDRNLQSLIGKTWQGANTPQLANGMRSLYENRNLPVNHPNVQAALKQISAARNVPMAKLQQDYIKYQAVRQAEIAHRGRESPTLDEKRFPNFQGSTSQMRYGQVVGDAFGIDPVFGSMLNPTGGLVGPDNHAVDSNDSALGYHGAVHDAAGYLYNAHNVGPGYNYLGKSNLATSNPLSGQYDGVNYWRDKLGESRTGVAADVGKGLWKVSSYEAGRGIGYVARRLDPRVWGKRVIRNWF